jgi:phosphoribosylformimino-5-aminoimidazole carboxamide ribotide isomerase
VARTLSEAPVPPFAIIPVLDLKQGEVVRARAGDRAHYRPLASPLAPSSRPADVIRGLLSLAPFRTVYVADLDAIAGTGRHDAVLAELHRAAPDAEFWLDGGFAGADDARESVGRGLVPVLGSESLASAAALTGAIDALGPNGFVLSLDYRGETFVGRAEIARNPALWPSRLILMTLDRVGMNAGSDTAGLREIIERAGTRGVYAAGGVRGRADLVELRRLGVAGALVATALHDGRLDRATLAEFLADGD